MKPKLLLILGGIIDCACFISLFIASPEHWALTYPLVAAVIWSTFMLIGIALIAWSLTELGIELPEFSIPVTIVNRKDD